MIKVKHALWFETEFDESEPQALRFLSIPEEEQVAMLERMLKDLLPSLIQDQIDFLNDGQRYATLRIAD